MKIRKQFITGNTIETIKAELLYIVNNEQHEAAFDKIEDIEGYFDGTPVTELGSSVEEKLTFTGEQVGNWIPTIIATITAYYKDAGSNEYAYLINVVED
jgi:hypothetical protein